MKPANDIMTTFTEEEVGKWLDQNPTFFSSYLIKKADMSLINQWLTEHGFVILCQGNAGTKSPVLLGPPSERRGSRSTCSSRRASGASMTSGGTLSPTSPHPDKPHDFPLLDDHDHGGGNNGSLGIGGPRSNSRRALRNDFARAKSRSVFQNEESSAGHPPSLASRRSSLKDMRKYASLPPNSINILSLLIESKVKLPRYASKHFELKRELRRMDDRAFFLDIVKDIANDLDLRSLTKKITENVSILVDAEAASLFILQGPKGKQTLVSKVLDVPIGSPWKASKIDSEGVEVALGAGILGWVAERGEPVNLEAPSQDPRYREGLRPTHSLLALPIRSPSDEEVIGVAQVVNKNPFGNSATFTLEDQMLLETYLQFVGIALTNASIMEATRREYDMNRNLLEVVHDLFEEQTSLESVILKIMQRAQRLLKCERAAVLLLDENSQLSQNDVKFSKLFELNTPMNGHHGSGELQSSNPPKKALECQATGNLMRLAEQVVSSGEVINIAEIVEVERGSGGNLKSLLAMPIRNRNSEIIGVATIVNKLNNMPFDEQDEQLFEAFTIFCGLGINNTLTYGELEMAIARRKVAIEVLSYHAAASNKDVEPLLEKEVPPCEELAGLQRLDFDDFSLEGDTMILAALRMFIDLSLVSKFKMDNTTLIRWLLTVQRNYRNVPYHNWRHAFNVAQVMFAILTSCEMKETFSELESLGLLVSCLCHDLDHRGTNNSFQAKTGSALALLYGTQNTMEHHHFNHAVMIINSEGHNIFSGLSQEEYSRVMNILKQCILATDLTFYFQRRAGFFSLISEGGYNWEDEGQRDTLRCMLMTASDLAASTKRWPVQKRVAELVTAEFFAQGDQEKQLQITPPAPMDRERKHELPQLQMRWIHDICLPLYQALSDMNPRFILMRDGAKENMNEWEKLTEGEVEEDKDNSSS